jgi:hypothetical protein
MPMLPGDARSAWDPSVIDDPRVTQLWDGDRIVGRCLADHRTGGPDRAGGIVWDAFLGFAPSGRWQVSRATCLPQAARSSPTPGHSNTSSYLSSQIAS